MVIFNTQHLNHLPQGISLILIQLYKLHLHNNLLRSYISDFIYEFCLYYSNRSPFLFHLTILYKIIKPPNNIIIFFLQKPLQNKIHHQKILNKCEFYLIIHITHYFPWLYLYKYITIFRFISINYKIIERNVAYVNYLIFIFFNNLL